ncbi:hypothetical protein K0M31_002566 [Melipona bicolor]|uniref:Uncharacterized protein n=1 Tax=Melipona bicolor TaxID=60889 RepID=A0AA40KYM9_9HYME|nr:hypothetical protein K0M31_002566 [Melipona bicolor]
MFRGKLGRQLSRYPWVPTGPSEADHRLSVCGHSSFRFHYVASITVKGYRYCDINLLQGISNDAEITLKGREESVSVDLENSSRRLKLNLTLSRASVHQPDKSDGDVVVAVSFHAVAIFSESHPPRAAQFRKGAVSIAGFSLRAISHTARAAVASSLVINDERQNLAEGSSK